VAEVEQVEQAPIKPNQTKSNLSQAKMDLPEANEGGGIQTNPVKPGQTRSNPVRFTTSRMKEFTILPRCFFAAFLLLGSTVHLLADDGGPDDFALVDSQLKLVKIDSDEKESLLALAADGMGETAAEVEVLLPSAVRLTVKKNEIAVRELQNRSPMPEGLVRTPAELSDLLAFFLMQKEPAAREARPAP
jgi:hypothetical protein